MAEKTAVIATATTYTATGGAIIGFTYNEILMTISVFIAFTSALVNLYYRRQMLKVAKGEE